MLRPMPRTNSVLGLFRRLVVLRWKKLSLNAKLAVVAAAVLTVGAIVSGALTCPASGGCCMRGEAAATVTPEPAQLPAGHPTVGEAEGDGCRYSDH
jgi:hypothetical protein